MVLKSYPLVGNLKKIGFHFFANVIKCSLNIFICNIGCLALKSQYRD